MWIRIRAVIVEDEPLAAQYLAALLLVFTTGIPGRAADVFRLNAVDYLLKPLDPEQVEKAVNRLLAYLAVWIS